MPYSLKWFKTVVVFEYSGIVTSSDILASNQEVYGDYRFDELRWQVVYFDEVEDARYSEVDVKKIAFLDRAAFLSNPNITVLFVGDQSLLGELYASYARFQSEQGWQSFHIEDRAEVHRYLAEHAGLEIV